MEAKEFAKKPELWSVFKKGGKKALANAETEEEAQRWARQNVGRDGWEVRLVEEAVEFGTKAAKED